jgi:hypothetical protein
VNARPRFGDQPLDQTVAAAAAIRRLSNLLLALEHPHPAVDTMLARFAQWEAELENAAPNGSQPRMDRADETSPPACRPQGVGRIYLDHAFDIGAFNPCFPEYRFDQLDTKTAEGRVTFPLVYEGPPGLVHGGFLALFFDCVTQHHNCAAALSGKTRSLQVRYRRPTPILTELRFLIERVEGERGITSTARLIRDDEVCCIGEVSTIAVAPDQLAGHRYAKRRAD